MERPVPVVGDVVLVENDFSTPEDWEYPATVISVDSGVNPQVHVKPFSSLFEEQHPFVQQCLILVKGKACQTFMDRAGTNEFPAALNPETKKLYFEDQPESEDDHGYTEDEAWFESLDGRRWEANDLTMIGDLEDQD